MPGQDPWDWTVEDVKDWVLTKLPITATSIPNARLPDIDALALSFEEQEVSGYALLSDVTTEFLRQECNIRAIGRRSVVLEAIRRLRKTSAEYLVHNGFGHTVSHGTDESARVSTPKTTDSKFSSPAMLPVAVETQERVTKGPFDKAPHRRSGEVLIEDDRGGKRRRLIFNKPSDTPRTTTGPEVSNHDNKQPPLAEFNSESPFPHLPYKKFTVDELMYGKTLAGQSTLAEVQDDDILTFCSSRYPSGIKHFANRSMRSMFLSERTVAVRWKGKQLTAFRPYKSKHLPPGLQASLTVFDGLDEDDEAVKVHEEAVELVGGALTNDAASGDWDYLLTRYDGRNGGEQVLPPLGGSEDGSDELSDIDSELAAELDEEEQPAVSLLPVSEAGEVFDDVVQQYAERWAKKALDRLERQEAWKIWRSVRGSGAKRKTIAAQNNQQLLHLTARLANQRRDILQIPWRAEDDLVKQCAITQPTVEDIERLRWEQTVWMRSTAPKPPPSTLSHKPAQKLQGRHPSRLPTSEDAEMDEFISDHEDARDVEVLPDIELPVTSIEDAEQEMGDVTGASEDDTTATAGAGSESDPLGMGELQNMQDAAAMSDDDLSFLPSDNTIVQRSSKRDGSRSHTVDSGRSLPEVKTIPKTRSSSTTKWQTTNNNIIEISSDDSSHKKRSPHRNVISSINPEDASMSEIQGWGNDWLTEQKDRKRIVSKLLLTLDAGIRAVMLERLTKEANAKAWLVIRVRKVLEQKATSGSKSTIPWLDSKFAGIYHCWHQCRVECWDLAMPPDMYNNINENDLKSWATYCLKVLPKIANFMQPGQFIDISSGVEDESDSPTVSAKKKKKKPRVLDSRAEEARDKAFTRMHQFAESQKQQTSDSNALSQMIPGSDDMREDIIVNLIREEDDNPIHLIDSLAKTLKAHQIEGLQFLWREVMADGDDGCVLAHTMGLGKTCQAISFLIMLKQAGEDAESRKQIPKRMRPLRALILCPPAVLQNWMREIDMWSPRAKFFEVFKIDATGNDQQERYDVLKKWYDGQGILLIGYTMFQKHVLVDDDKQSKGGQSAESTDADASLDEDVPLRSGNVLSKQQRIQMAKMLTAGPNIVIADEAHMLKNDKSKVSQAASKFKRAKRIALSGTPLSNATREIFSIVNWVAPNYLGSKGEFEDRFAKPIEAGLYNESTSAERRKSLKKLAVLRTETEPKIHRMDITALKGSLTSKTEYNLTIPLTDLQMRLYRKYTDYFTSQVGGEKVTQVQLFGWVSLLGLLVTHPKALRNKLMEKPKESKDADDLKKKRGQPRSIGAPSATAPMVAPAALTILGEGEDDTDEGVIGDEHVSKLGLSSTLIKELVEEIPESADVSASYRMMLIEQILELSKKVGDKVLVFSLRLPLLDCMGALLLKMGISFGRIDGSMPQPKREMILKAFREDRYDVLLISTKAGGQGLNIQNANRVIIVDFSYNPTWEEQAVGRAYRLGQKKDVYVYRFVSGGTFEDKLYNMGLFKSSLFQRVVDKKNPERHAKKGIDEWLFAPREVKQEVINEEEVGKDKNVLEKILARSDNPIRAIKTMETLMRNVDDEHLTEAELREVQVELEQNKAVRNNSHTASRSLLGGAYPSSTAPVGVGVRPPMGMRTQQSPPQAHQRPPSSTVPSRPQLQPSPRSVPGMNRDKAIVPSPVATARASTAVAPPSTAPPHQSIQELSLDDVIRQQQRGIQEIQGSQRHQWNQSSSYRDMNGMQPSRLINDTNSTPVGMRPNPLAAAQRGTWGFPDQILHSSTQPAAPNIDPKVFSAEFQQQGNGRRAFNRP
ncbi:Protein CHROMATIN REMODELING 20 [Sphaceloma murrayae]|uniref:Protein CHROMATIN REMODELING 20 n=1 Tax=Sphaceloma murrayae TaxID=2082308 RepID=A0A2K1QKF5_9PEZI|nr:Protein CHROMATIN REMODELING 20 [Sphaceloma murrayae]